MPRVVLWPLHAPPPPTNTQTNSQTESCSEWHLNCTYISQWDWAHTPVLSCNGPWGGAVESAPCRLFAVVNHPFDLCALGNCGLFEACSSSGLFHILEFRGPFSLSSRLPWKSWKQTRAAFLSECVHRNAAVGKERTTEPLPWLCAHSLLGREWSHTCALHRHRTPTR